MKLFVSGFALLTLWTVPAHAIGSLLAAGTYLSTGTWNASDGTTGNWNDEMVITQIRGGYNVKDTLTVHTPSGPVTQTNEWAAMDKPSGFFDVEEAGAVIGWGFCDKTTCQIQGETATEKRAETITVGTFSVSRVGWGEEGGNRMTWKGSVRKK